MYRTCGVRCFQQGDERVRPRIYDYDFGSNVVVVSVHIETDVLNVENRDIYKCNFHLESDNSYLIRELLDYHFI